MNSSFVRDLFDVLDNVFYGEDRFCSYDGVSKVEKRGMERLPLEASIGEREEREASVFGVRREEREEGIL